MTKPKTDYQIYFVTQDQGHNVDVYNSVTKTEYDFFIYLQSQGFSDDSKVQSYLNHEAAQAEETERQKKEQLVSGTVKILKKIRKTLDNTLIKVYYRAREKNQSI